MRWVLLMAWRDGRHSWQRLLLYMSAIVMGVAALVSIRSFGENLLAAVEDQAKILLGADLVLRSNAPFDPEDEALFTEIGGRQARQVEFASMALFPEQDATRLVQVRGISGEFPFYGELGTDPPAAAKSYQRDQSALVDETLMLQFGVQVGDPLKLGNSTFTIVGRLLEIPGDSAVASDLAPRIFIPGRDVQDTGLVQTGSRIRYRIFFKLGTGQDPDGLVESLKERLRALDLSADTVSERKEDFRHELTNLNRFLSLVGFVALVLGGIGVASSIHLYVRQRMTTIAVLRCVGASPRQSFAIYLVQTGLLGLLGAAVGVILGVLAQRLLPVVLGGFLPFEFDQSVSARAIFDGFFVGLSAAILFTLIPLAPIRRISPLLTLRSDVEAAFQPRRDPLVWILTAIVLAALLGFSLWYSTTWMIGLGFFGGLVAVFGLLFGVAKAIMLLTRRFFPSSWRYEYRQGLANLFRPHNQTVVLILSVGLGTFFIVTLYLTQTSLLQEVQKVGSGTRPNLVLFDIQSDQVAGVTRLLEANRLAVQEQVPVVTMRLSVIDGTPTEQLREDPKWHDRRWALFREYRCTYRDHLTDAETLTEGSFPAPSGSSGIQVSLEKRIADELKAHIGDRLVFDVQGIPIEVQVGSIRSVEWRSFQPNFFVLFPPGVLEDAPQFHVIVTRTDSKEQSALFQRALVRDFPNVSAIDLSLVLETIDSVLDRLSFVIRFMAFFSVITGFLVMIAAIVSGRFQRMRESVLLRTLGASRRQIRTIFLMEYFFLGLFSATTGVLLSLVASWGVVTFVFETSFVPAPEVVVGAFLVVTALTIVVGLSNSRGIFNSPPLEALRSEE
jgi:putative ABC transport system permease protein